MLKMLTGLVSKVVRYYVQRLTEAARYSINIIKFSLVTFLVMQPLASVSGWFTASSGHPYPKENIVDLLNGNDPTLLLVAVTALAIGIMEEVVMRYLIQDCLLEQWYKAPKWLSIIIASLLFGLVHLMNPGGMVARIPQALATVAAGFWFGHLYRKHGLHVAMMTHALYDFVGLMLIWKFPS